MQLAMTPTLHWLTLAIALTGLLWMPYIGYLLKALGPIEALMEGGGAEPEPNTWARRAKKAHYNAVENLAIFAPLTLIVCALGRDNATTAMAALVYLLVRAAHYVIYTLGLPAARTVLFLSGVGCQGVMLGRILGWI
ncbi:MAPEG family protein [Novosphingobium sp.]|uniref:MAPEG family protein n=1 Tax=Novosphingobium sp. TaxID=1874826 RepID=UPI0025D3B693|nr:MAPEG family protein [Novosphingobium sp.]MCC6926781.1 MAPEG family protein [Novosphingobium sp.]